jgi:hypothetical protein
MAGTVLDEGLFVLILAGQHAHISAGTIFFPLDFQTEDISIWMNANYTPSPLGADVLSAGVDKVMSLYPDDPSAGSPFGTGNETFGTGPGFKRGAAIYGDLLFQAPRRFLSQTSLAPSYAYIFTDHQSDANPVLGVNHSAELPYLFIPFAYSGPPEHAWLSQVMLDYWISFAVSLTPNDGKGISRTLSYTPTLFCAYSDPVFRTSLGGVRRKQGKISKPSPNWRRKILNDDGTGNIGA